MSNCLSLFRDILRGEGINEDVQSWIFSFAATAVALVFLCGKFLHSWSFFSLHSSAVVDFSGGVVALISRGYSFAIGWLVQPVLVLMFATRRPSLPMIRLSMIASLQLTRFVSSWTCTGRQGDSAIS